MCCAATWKFEPYSAFHYHSTNSPHKQPSPTPLPCSFSQKLRRFTEEMGRKRRMRRCCGSTSQAATPLKHFCKTISPDILEDNKLRIPNAFVNEFKDELSDVAKVVDPRGLTWEIGLTKSEKHIWFDNGWHKFIQHYSIHSGYVLVFGYKGSSSFNVLICDMSDFEIQYPENGLAETEELGNVEAEDDETETETVTRNSGSCHRYALRRIMSNGKTSRASTSKRDSAGKQNQWTNGRCLTADPSVKLVEEQNHEAYNPKREKFDEERISWMRTLVVNEIKDGENVLLPEQERFAEEINVLTSGFRNASAKSETAIYNARKFKTKNPSFMILLRPYHISHNFMYFPIGFSKKYMSSRVPAYVKLRVSDEREWVARINGGRQALTIGGGWKYFVRENQLDEGDVLVFEWIEKDITMKISIFHAAQDDPLGDSSTRANDALAHLSLP